MPLRATAARESRAELLERLRERRGEIEDAVMARIIALAEPPERGGAEYVQGLRAAVEVGLGYAIDGLERSEHEPPFVPEALLAQARLAARSGVGLDTVLRRYVAGHALLGDFLVQEAEGRIPPGELQRLLQRLASTLDVLLAAVTAAYGLEEHRHRRTAEERRTALVERLLAGEPLDASALGYEFEGWHLGLVVSGPGAAEIVRTVAEDLGRRVLLVPSDETGNWAWIGGAREFDAEEIERVRSVPARTGLRFVLGEPGEGLSGWRLTHRQAKAALSVAVCSEEPIVCYRDVALLASVAQDELLAVSLRRLYLRPLDAGRDGGVLLCETLRAYFGAQGNLSAAAAALGVSRKTVNSRLRTVEQRLGVPLSECAGSLELAIQMAQTLGNRVWTT